MMPDTLPQTTWPQRPQVIVHTACRERQGLAAAAGRPVHDKRTDAANAGAVRSGVLRLACVMREEGDLDAVVELDTHDPPPPPDDRPARVAPRTRRRKSLTSRRRPESARRLQSSPSRVLRAFGFAGPELFAKPRRPVLNRR
jgi:hypothetical protein